MAATLPDLLTGEASGTALVVRAAALAEAVCGQSWSDVCADATQLVGAAKRLSALFGLRALVLGDDPALVVDQALAPSRVATLAEAIGRLAAEGAGLPVICLLPGPIALGAITEDGSVDEAVKEAFAAAAEAICEGRPVLLLFDEATASASAMETMAARRLYNTLRNVAGYFDVKIGALLPEGASGALAGRMKLDVAFAPDGGPEQNAEFVVAVADGDALAGFALFVAMSDKLARIAAQAQERGLLVIARAENGTTIEAMHAFMRAAGDAGY